MTTTKRPPIAAKTEFPFLQDLSHVRMTYFSHYYKAPFSIYKKQAQASTESPTITDTTHIHSGIMHGLPKQIKLSCRVIALEICVSFMAAIQDFLALSPKKVQA